MQTSNLPKLSNRAKLALDVLANGGRFCNRLETDRFTGRDQFHHRLFTGRCTGIVKGVGAAAFYELEKAGMLEWTNEGTSSSTYYKLRAQ